MPLSEPEMDHIDAALPGADADGADAPRTQLTGREALEKIRAGETLDNVRIERLVFKGEFPLPVRLKRCVLVQPSFDGAKFHGEVLMVGCTLDRPRFGKPTEFVQNFDLTGATLHRAQLQRLTVKGRLSFDNATCRGRFVLSESRLEGGVRFWETRFAGWAELRNCEFPAEADLRSFHAEEGFVLRGCKFAGDFLLRGSTVSKKFEATDGTRYDGLVDFSKAKLHDFAYLENIEQGDRQRFAFANTVGERLRIRTDQLVGRLASEERGDYDAAMHEYAFLKRAFQSLHRYDQEDWAFYRFKVNQRRCCGRSWLRPWTKVAQFLDWLILDQGCGYCTDPFRAVRTAGIIMLLFALLYMVGIESFHLDKSQLPFDGEQTDLLNRVTIGLYQSVATFVSGLSGIGDMAHGWMNLALITEALLGTLLWGLFIVAFSRKIIR